jgi:hypothetical protein
LRFSSWRFNRSGEKLIDMLWLYFGGRRNSDKRSSLNRRVNSHNKKAVNSSEYL